MHIIKNNRPQYVVLTEERYNELLEMQEEAALAQIKASLEDTRAGRITLTLLITEHEILLLDIGAHDEMHCWLPPYKQARESQGRGSRLVAM